MYELIILSLLTRFSSLHGYMIAKIANDALGPWTKVSNGSLYPLLTRLEQAGLIAEAEEEAEGGRKERHTRNFSLTEAGHIRFHQVMMDTASNLGDYQKVFHYKVAFLDLLTSRERLHLLNHYTNYCQTSLLYLQAEAADLAHELPAHDSNPIFLEAMLDLMQHKVQQWQAEIDWTLQLSAKFVAGSALRQDT